MTKTIPVNWKHVGSRIVNYFTTFPQGYYKGVADQIVSGPHYPYPKYVWSFTGGWWPHPANWKRNTGM